MIESVIAFLLVWLASPFILGGLLFVSWWFDRNEHEIFSTLVLFSFFFGVYLILKNSYQIDAKHILYFAISYIPIGVLWSFFRFKRLAIMLVSRFNKDIKEFQEKEEENTNNSTFYSSRRNECRRKLADSLQVKNNVSRIAGWIFCWPISFLDHLVGDILTSIERLVSVHFKGLYNRIADSALKGVEDDAESLVMIKDRMKKS